AEACPIDPAPSTSGTKQFKKDAKARTASSDEKRELESLTVRSLDAIVKITEMLRQGDTSGFINILEKVFSVVDGENSSNRNAKYAFIHDLLCNILEADLDELVAAKKHFDNVFLQTSLKIPLIDEADILRLGPIGEGNSSIILVGVLKSQDKKVALKRARAPKWNQVIEDEANVLSNLKHKNILKIFGRHQVHPEIVLEFMDLGNLVSAVEIPFRKRQVPRLARPKLCPENFFNYFVNNLLSVDPKDRPSFTDIKAKLKDFTRNN
ncbi:hypothetical protein NQ315_007411, partial [Exocentrus adspersus]